MALVGALSAGLCPNWGFRRQCTFGNKVWFGYWEGDVEGGATFAWTSQPKLTGFLDHTKDLWDQDGEEEEEAAPDAGGDDDDEV